MASLSLWHSFLLYEWVKTSTMCVRPFSPWHFWAVVLMLLVGVTAHFLSHPMSQCSNNNLLDIWPVGLGIHNFVQITIHTKSLCLIRHLDPSHLCLIHSIVCRFDGLMPCQMLQKSPIPRSGFAKCLINVEKKKKETKRTSALALLWALGWSHL